MMHGRVFLISLPFVGSKLMSQISPRETILFTKPNPHHLRS